LLPATPRATDERHGYLTTFAQSVATAIDRQRDLFLPQSGPARKARPADPAGDVVRLRRSRGEVCRRQDGVQRAVLDRPEDLDVDTADARVQDGHLELTAATTFYFQCETRTVRGGAGTWGQVVSLLVQ
jgi:hypothetical protein